MMIKMIFGKEIWAKVHKYPISIKSVRFLTILLLSINLIIKS